MFQSTHYRSFWIRVSFSHLHWYWQYNKNNRETTHN